MTSIGQTHLMALAGCLGCLAAPCLRAQDPPTRNAWEWTTASPESQGMSSVALESAWAALMERHTAVLLVIRHDRIVFEPTRRARAGPSRTTPHRWPRPSWQESV